MIVAASFLEIAAGDIIQAVIILAGVIIWITKLRDKVKELEKNVIANVQAVKHMDTLQKSSNILEQFAKTCSERQEKRHGDIEKWFREITERTARIEGKLDRMNGNARRG